MDNIIQISEHKKTVGGECPCCTLREGILDLVAESGLDLAMILFVLDNAKDDAMELCASNEDGGDDAA